MSCLSSSAVQSAASADWCSVLRPAAPWVLWSARLFTHELMRAYPPSRNLRGNKARVHAMCKARGEASPKGSSPQRLMRVTRVDSTKLLPELLTSHPRTLLSASTQLVIEKRVYAYGSSPPRETHWHVNFADAHLFGFYASSLFAQDEWQCLEHPALCALRDFMQQASSDGSEPEAKPLTVSSRVPTPVLVMNAPREVSIDAVGANLYGHAFCSASEARVDAATTLISPTPTLSHIIAMEALKHRQGGSAYTAKDIALTLHTAVASFSAARRESEQEAKDVAAAEGSGDKATSSAASTPPLVVIHTGNWGCGAFGGNAELMCLLQLLAARMAGIEQLVYHVLSDDNATACANATKRAEEIIAQMRGQEASAPASASTDGAASAAAGSAQSSDLMDLAKRIEALGYKWGYGNGT